MNKRTKEQRQRWWRNLTDKEKDAYIKKVQKRKEIKRRDQAPREPVEIEVNPETKDAWLEKIHKKNPWLKKSV